MFKPNQCSPTRNMHFKKREYILAKRNFYNESRNSILHWSLNFFSAFAKGPRWHSIPCCFLYSSLPEAPHVRIPPPTFVIEGAERRDTAAHIRSHLHRGSNPAPLERLAPKRCNGKAPIGLLVFSALSHRMQPSWQRS